MKKRYAIAALLSCALFSQSVNAQLSTNPDKFLGNITTWGSPNGGGLEFASLWNQMTCENECKWASCEGNRNNFGWGGADQAYKYCKSHNIPFKWHALIWGAQYPKWVESLTPEQRLKEIKEWMTAVHNRYPDLTMIDVANECIEGHQAGTKYFIEALGGKGQTGWDWLIKAFEMAHELWPDAILIYNDFNTFQWNTDQFIELVTALRNAGAPVDAYGCQSHDLTGYGLNGFKNSMNKLQNALKMPMYSTEYDIGTEDDNLQKTNYSEQLKYMWEQDYVAGVTLWGYIYGRTWTTDGNSGIIRDGKDRPAMTWLRDYMKTDAAKKAKSPFPGMQKEASLYIQPSSRFICMGQPSEINLRARLRTKQIDRIEFYANNKLVETLIEAPYVAHFTPGVLGENSLKAVLVATDGSRYERYGAVMVGPNRGPYGTSAQSLPGTLQAENFDKGVEGVAFHDVDGKNQGNANFRTTEGGVDIDNGGTGKVISYTEDGEWLEYTVKVKQGGMYSYEASVVAGAPGSAFSLSLKTDEGYVPLTESIEVPCVKEGQWTTYRNLWGRTLTELPEGEQIIRVTFDKGGCNLDRIVFKQIDIAEDFALNIESDPSPAYLNEYCTLRFTSNYKEENLKNVTVYINDVKNKTISSAPFEMQYKPTATGIIDIKAVATDMEDMQSQVAQYSLEVTKHRYPYNDVVAELPGEVEAENFDVMGEGFSFHDTDKTDEGKTKYRTDNEGMDIVKTVDGYALGKFVTNEWCEYTVDVKESGNYGYEMWIATGNETCRLQFEFTKTDGSEDPVSLRRSVSAGKDLTKFKKVSATSSQSLHLTEGRYILRITDQTGECSLDKINFICSEPDGVKELAMAPLSGTFDVYSPAGIWLGRVESNSRSEAIEQIKKLGKQQGIYVLKNVSKGTAISIKM